MFTSPVALPPPVASVYVQEAFPKSTYFPKTIYTYQPIEEYVDTVNCPQTHLQPTIELDQQQNLIMCMAYKNSFVDFDGHCEIKLISPVRFRIEDNGKTFRCLRWGCECSKLDDIEVTLTRRFSQLSYKALNNMLQEDERIFWSNIVSDIDYADYYAQIMPPIFVTAKVVTIKKHKVTVQRNVDNCFMNITGNAMKNCSAWRKGDHVEMLVKLDKNDEIVSISHAHLVEKFSDQQQDPMESIEVIKI